MNDTRILPQTIEDTARRAIRRHDWENRSRTPSPRELFRHCSDQVLRQTEASGCAAVGSLIAQLIDDFIRHDLRSQQVLVEQRLNSARRRPVFTE